MSMPIHLQCCAVTDSKHEFSGNATKSQSCHALNVLVCRLVAFFDARSFSVLGSTLNPAVFQLLIPFVNLEIPRGSDKTFFFFFF